MPNRMRWSYDGWRMWGLTTAKGEEYASWQRSVLDGDLSKADVVTPPDSGAFVWQCTQPVNISGFAYLPSGSDEILTLKVSSNSTDGVDGYWTTLATSSTVANTYTEVSITTTECTWIQAWISAIHSRYQPFRAFWFFGEYKSPLYELWDVTESNELTAQYPFTLPQAKTDANYSQRVQFKLKNVDTSTNSYTLTVVAIRYGGDAAITTYMKLSTNGGIDKTLSVNVTGLTGGSFSGAIDLWLDLPKANNPGDGYHYYAVHVEQTT